MSEPLKDAQARARFRDEWNCNFAVSANAGSGKTTAISERLASMALSHEAAALLPKTAVVTFTKKAALQIGQRARSVLARRLSEAGSAGTAPLDHLERAFFGTIHSFCLLLAQRYGQALGLNLNPTVVADDDEAVWEEFVEQDSMEFESLEPAQLAAFLRHVPLEAIFDLARGLTTASSHELSTRRPMGRVPAPSEGTLNQILAFSSKAGGTARENVLASQRAAREWWARFNDSAEAGFLPLFTPIGKSEKLVELADAWMAPLKAWLADAASALAAELAARYRVWRFERGIQTYADQTEAALAVLQDVATLDAIRRDGWRVILDEAQDTDSEQFAVLTEITRPPGASLGTWPDGGGAAPRPGHFCMVGDGQQAIYGARADIRNFSRQLEAFARGDGGELLVFRVTFRAPRRVIALLNAGFPTAFGPGQSHNLGLPVADDVAAQVLQVRYEPLEGAPGNEEGWAHAFRLEMPAEAPDSIEGWQAEEAGQLARFLKEHGPASVGARSWSEICVLAPRIDWLVTTRRAFEKAGLKVVLQIRRNRNGDHPVYAWLTGLLSVLCDPENAFEWFGVLREVFAVSDALLASELRAKGAFRWDDPQAHPEPLRNALEILRPWLLQVDDEGVSLEQFAGGLARACALREKACAIDPEGCVTEELDRLLAEAAELGLGGAGPREWLKQLQADLDAERPSGKFQDDAINLLTSHSAKGLEWPVVIPVGLWRGIGKPPERGLRLVATEGRPRVFFDGSSLPADMREARERERLRELVRLLYVTFTRARRHLVLPWNAEFGGRQRSDPSFIRLWSVTPLIEALPVLRGEALPLSGSAPEFDGLREVSRAAVKTTAGKEDWTLPERLLPHQLAKKKDATREAKHEEGPQGKAFAHAGDEAIDYGLWWHETMEFMPWDGDDAAVDAYCRRAIESADAHGFRARAEGELRRFRASGVWGELRRGAWRRMAEVAVFAPLATDVWIDGVMDLVLHDEQAGELWIVDWKTNRAGQNESARELLQRLSAEYAPQLQAYGRSAALFFAGAKVRLWVYASAAGDWVEVPEPA